MSLLYDSNDSRVLGERKARSQAGLNRIQHPGSQGNIEAFQFLPFFHLPETTFTYLYLYTHYHYAALSREVHLKIIQES